MRKLFSKTISKVLLVVYVTAIFITSFIHIPYNRIEVRVSSQNVPHETVVFSDYGFHDEVYGYVSRDEYNKVDSQKIAFHIFMYTIALAAGLTVVYFSEDSKSEKAESRTELSSFEEHIKTIISEAEMPVLDLNSLAFADEETVAKAQKEYAEKMKDYCIAASLKAVFSEDLKNKRI